jgi:hypothetical protein
VNIFVNVMLVINKSIPINVKLNVLVLILKHNPLRLVVVMKTGFCIITWLVTNLTAYQIVLFMDLKLLQILMEHVIVTSSIHLMISLWNVLLIVLNSMVMKICLVLIILLLVVNVLRIMFTKMVCVRLIVLKVMKEFLLMFVKKL